MWVMVMRQRLKTLAALGAVLGLGLIGIASEPTCAFAQSSSCTSACRAQHSQCRIATKGSPSCDAQLQSCLQGCLSGRR